MPRAVFLLMNKAKYKPCRNCAMHNAILFLIVCNNLIHLNLVIILAIDYFKIPEFIHFAIFCGVSVSVKNVASLPFLSIK